MLTSLALSLPLSFELPSPPCSTATLADFASRIKPSESHGAERLLESTCDNADVLDLLELDVEAEEVDAADDVPLKL